MDTCDIVDLLGRGLLLLVSIGALIDSVRRDIPRAITMFRVFLTAYTCNGILREIMRISSYVVAEGVLNVLSSGLIWPLCLYFLEHFARVFLTIDLKDRTRNMTNLFKFWTGARISVFVVSASLAITFGFSPSNGIILGKGLISLVCFVVVVLPVCGTILRLIFALRAHLGESFEAGSERAKKLKSTYRQLVGFFVILSTINLIALVLNIRGLIDSVAYLDVPYVFSRECTIGASFYRQFLPMILALFLTRFPNARRRWHKFASTQGMSESSRESALKRSKLKKPEITSACVEPDEPDVPVAHET